MGSGKAYPKLDMDAPLAEIAVRLTGHSLARMLKFYERSVCKPRNDPEDVHQLRVYSRRLAASLDSFDTLLRDESAKKLKRSVRQVRRAAGHARDMDVALQDVQKWAQSAPPSASGGVVYLAGWFSGGRDLAQETLGQVYSSIPPKELGRLFEESFASSGVRNTQGDFKVFGRELVSEHLVRLIEHLTIEDSTRDLHRIRIDLKRLRYTVELFGQALHKELSKSVLTTCRELQEILGTHQDSVVAVLRLQEMVKWARVELGDRIGDVEPGLLAMIEFQQDRATRSAEAFEQQVLKLTERFRNYQAKL